MALLERTNPCGNLPLCGIPPPRRCRGTPLSQGGLWSMHLLHRSNDTGHWRGGVPPLSLRTQCPCFRSPFCSVTIPGGSGKQRFAESHRAHCPRALPAAIGTPRVRRGSRSPRWVGVVLSSFGDMVSPLCRCGWGSPGPGGGVQSSPGLPVYSGCP